MLIKRQYGPKLESVQARYYQIPDEWIPYQHQRYVQMYGVWVYINEGEGRESLWDIHGWDEIRIRRVV